ncbi:MAG: hypothetical protein ACRC3G_00470 [Bacteroidales bacterium]
METKVPFYNVVNMFLTGLIFTGCCIIIYNSQVSIFISSELFRSIKEINFGIETIVTISFFAVIYEIGFIINRIGSLFGSFLKLIKAIPFNKDYKKFNDKKAQYSIMEILSREFALSRTSMTLFALLAIISCTQQKCIFFIIFCAINIVFYFSMRKHAKKIVGLMKD